jgi:putative chitinase
VLAYDAEAGRGAGYGSAGGDDRVHRLQAALNRLGLKDADGKSLKADGKLGPKTTAAIEAAQKELGLTANGRITPALLDKLAAAKRTVGRQGHAGGEEGEALPAPRSSRRR